MGLFSNKKKASSELRKLKKSKFEKALFKKKKIKFIIDNSQIKLAAKVKKKQSVYHILHKNNIYLKHKKYKKITYLKNNNEQIRILIDKINKNFELLTFFSYSVGDIDIKLNELNNKAKIIKEGSDVQAQSLYSIKQYMDTIYDNLEESGKEAKDLSYASKDTIQKVKNKKDDILTIIEEFYKIKDLLISTMEYSLLLEEKSNEAENLLTSIDNISKQTNLLSINASIEAARAGEQGKGFSIVAQEVRKLSEKTSKTSSDINVLIDQMQNISQKNNEAMQISLKEIENHFKIYQKIVDDLNEIEESTEQFSQSNIFLSEKLREQVDQFDVINQNFAKIIPSITKNTASVNDISTAIHAEARQIGKINNEAEEMENNLIYMLETLSKNIKREKNILIVSAAIYPPFIIYDEESKEIRGMDIDMIKEIAARAGIALKIDLSSWSGSLIKAKKGLVDVIPSTYATKERLAFLEFSEELRENVKYIFLTKKGSHVRINTYEDLYRYNIGVMTDYDYDDKFTCDEEIKKEKAVDISFLFEKLMQEKIDAMIIHEYSADYYLVNQKLQEELEKQEFSLIQKKSERIGFCKERELQKQIEIFNEKIIEIKQDGTFQKITENYLRKTIHE